MSHKYLYNFILMLCGLFLIATQSFAEPTNLDLLKKTLVAYHDSGTYFKDIKAVANQAMADINQAVELNAQLPQPKKLAIVLDIDETSLTNFANMKQNDFANIPDVIKSQLLAADEPAIEPILELYTKALQKNIAIFFITGRDATLAQATQKNLRKAGYQSWSGLEFREPRIPSSLYKTKARKKIAQQGYQIIASIGDQVSDLVGGYAQHTYKLPNPFYYIP